tara:strand:- start:15648 stop:16574 length:927 start_codon:yes stop_codon:yes gene_type:complete
VSRSNRKGRYESRWSFWIVRTVVYFSILLLTARGHGSELNTILTVSPDASPDLQAESFADRKLRDIIGRQEAIFGDIENREGSYSQTEFDNKLQQITHSYEEYLLQNPDKVIAYILYGKLLYKVGQYEHAVLQFLNADKLDPNIAVVKQQLGNYMAENGKVEEALGFFFQAVELSPKTALYYYQLGEVMHVFRSKILTLGLFSESELEESMLQTFANAARLAPDNRIFRFRYAESFYDVQNPDWEAALLLWADLQKGATPGLEADAVRLHRAKVLLMLKRFDEALDLASIVETPALETSRQEIIDHAK